MSLSLSEQLLEQIKRAKQIAVITSKNPRPDSVAAALSMALILKRWNKTFDVILPPQKQSLPSILPKQETKASLGATRAFHMMVDVKETGISELLYDVKDNTLNITIIPKQGNWTPKDIAFKQGQDRYDLIIAIDCEDINACQLNTKEEIDLVYRTHVINIGHESQQEAWGQINLLDLSCSSTTEVLFHWIQANQLITIDRDLSNTLLTGILIKTQSFRNEKISPRTLETASKLIELGADREKLTHELWRNKSISTLKLWGKLLGRLEQDTTTGITWTITSREDLLSTQAEKQDFAAMVDEMIMNMPETKTVCIGYIENNHLEIQTFSTHPHHAGKIMQIIGGNGSAQRGSHAEQSEEPQKRFRSHIKTIIEKIKTDKSFGMNAS